MREAVLRQKSGTSSQRLIQALQRARLGWWAGALERTLVVSLIGAAIATIASWPFRWLSGASGVAWTDENLVFTSTILVVSLLAITIAMLAVYAFRAPSLLAIARRCDHELQQQQRISTAFEVLERHGDEPSSVVLRRLLEDVERRLPTLDLQRAVRDPIPRALRTTLVSAVVTASIALAVPVPRASQSIDPVATAPTTTRAALTPSSAEETIELAETIADRLASEPIADRDPFVRAVAEGFSELAVQLREESIDVAQADEMVQDLLSYLEDAVDRTGGSLEDVVREAMPEGIDRGRGEDSNATIPGLGGEGSEGEEGRQSAEGVDARPQDSSSGASDDSALERLAEALERRAEEREANALDGPTESFGGDENDPYGQQVNVAREPTDDSEPGLEPLMRAEGEAAGRAAGAAQRSSDAAGDAAGGGSADVSGRAADFERDDAQVELTPLESRGQDEGRRIETSFAPTEGDARDRDVTTMPPERAFDRADENGTPSRTLGWTHRDVVRRYFLPDAAEAAIQSQ